MLVAVVVEREFEAAHPLGPLRLSALTQSVVLIAAIAAIVVLVMLLRSSARRFRETTEPYAKVFRSTLVVVFGFVLIMFVMVLIWGPHSLHWRSANRWIAAAPFGSLLLGVLFGSIGAEWVTYLMTDDGFARTRELEAQHKRWGFVLLALLLLGVFVPLSPQLLGKISGGNVTTPLGGISFSTQPVSTIREPAGAGSSVGSETQETRLWESLAHLGNLMKRDREYKDLFYRDRGEELAALNGLHIDGDPFAERVLEPLGKCIAAHFEIFNNRGLIQRALNDVVVTYTKLLHPPKSDKIDAKGLAAQMAASAAVLGMEMRNTAKPDAAKPCDDAKDAIESAKDKSLIVPALPYAAMGLAYLLYDSGETEQAMRELASWIEDHYLATGKSSIAECSKGKGENCAYYGYRPTLKGGAPGEWRPLPAWYRIRIEFELIEMLHLTVNRRVSFLAARTLVHTIESLFSEFEVSRRMSGRSAALRFLATPIDLSLERPTSLSRAGWQWPTSALSTSCCET